MKAKNVKKPRPWLKADGVEIPTTELKTICQTWSSETWGDYLKWYESSLRERLIPTGIFDARADDRAETIFEEFNQSADFETYLRCERLLDSIPADEARVLRLAFFEGLTERAIAAIVGKSASGVHRIKARALTRLKREHHGDEVSTRHFVRGESIAHRDLCESPRPDQCVAVKEARAYDPINRAQEFERLPSSALRMALKEITPIAQEVLYLAYWCEWSIPRIARELKTGSNVINQVMEAALFKLKRLFIEIETGVQPGGQTWA